MNHINLLGNPIENFYTLGQKDKVSFSAAYNLVSKLCTRNGHLAKIFQTTISVSNFLKSDHLIPEYQKYLEAYAEGLDHKLNEVYTFFILPEVVASFNKWLPQLSGLIPGCSSLFYWDEKNKGVIHNRLLDYAAAGIFDKFERSMSYEFTGEKKIFSYSSTGIPFASISGMNENGLTLALHHKHGNYFDLTGHSIFIIADLILRQCENVHQVKRILAQHPSISYWGLYLSDRNGDVASIDICGKDIFIEKFDVRDHAYLYFHNRPLMQTKQGKGFAPFGHKFQCEMRSKSVAKKMNGFKAGKKSLQEELLINLCTPLLTKKDSAKNFLLDPVTPGTIQALSFHTSLKESHYINGAAPKIYQGSLTKVKHLFSDINFEQIEKENSKTPSDYALGFEFLAKSQSYFDRGKTEEGYHSIQMALFYLKHYEIYSLVKFFFCVWQYIYETHTKDLQFIYNDLLELENKLPPYLEEHRIIFIMRLGKLLGHEFLDLSSQINNPHLKEIYLKESKLFAPVIKLLKNTIFPRVEILDILHL